jgi:hypothetical protein
MIECGRASAGTGTPTVAGWASLEGPAGARPTNTGPPVRCPFCGDHRQLEAPRRPGDRLWFCGTCGRTFDPAKF